MRSSGLFTVLAILLAWSLAVVPGCKYDVAEPLWQEPYATPPTPAITQIQPSSAPAGVNTITIIGQNLGGVLDTNGVYFGTTPAEVVQKSATSVVVRRPNLVTDYCTVKVVSDSALVVAKAPFGSINRVMDRFGDFRDNLALGVVVVDSAENVYVVSGSSPYTIWKVTPDGQKTVLALSGAALRSPYDARIRGGTLYLTGNNREVLRVNLTTGAVSRWTQFPSGKVIRFGDFDANGYFYAGGSGTDLCIVPPNPPTTLDTSQISLARSYNADEILATRVYNGYVYVASRQASTQNPAKIWRHPIDSAGHPGTQELILDLGATSSFSSRLVKSMTFSASGTMYITTDSPNPMLVFNPTTSAVDYLYKNIVPSYGKHSYWGTGNILYMISGDITNTDTALRWNVIRINTGVPGAPYY